jgi:zinc protease
VIGYPDLFDQLTPDDIRAYYRERYVPNNVFFVVVGDVNEADVVARIREAYAGNRAKSLSPMVLPAEPRQTAPRELVEQAPVELGHVHFGWHIPDLRHPDVPGLDVLATLLGSGRSSRLYREVRERRGLVHAVDAWTYTSGHTGLLGLSAVVDPDRFAPAREAMLAQIARLQEEPVSRRELGKALRQFVAGAFATRKTMQGQAQDLGANWLAADDLGFSEHYLAAVQRVTPRDLQRVARTYLRDTGRTVFGLLPRQAMPRSRRPAPAVIRHPILKLDLDNGLRLLLKGDHRLPFIEFRAVFHGGVLTETPADNGLTWLMSRLLLKGTARRSAEQIAVESESIGGQIDSYGGNNSFGVNAEVLRGDFTTGLDLLADVLLHPTFPGAELERERTVQLAGIKAQRDQLLKSAGQAMRRVLFGEVGYGLDLLGTSDSVSRLGVRTVQAFHHRLTRPNNCVLAVAGDFDPRKARAALGRVLGRWQPGPGLPPALPSLLPRPAEGSAPRRVREVRDKQQAVLVVGYPGASLQDADRFALELLQEVCSDLGSRLFRRIRDELGLAYYVGAQNFAGLAPGYFSLYAGTAPCEAARVETELLHEAQALATEGVTADELARAKAKLIGQRKIARQDLGNLAATVALDELYGLGYANFETEDAQYEAVTAEAVCNAARRYLRLDRAVIAIVTPS